jgi:hypothetical protein
VRPTRPTAERGAGLAPEGAVGERGQQRAQVVIYAVRRQLLRVQLARLDARASSSAGKVERRKLAAGLVGGRASHLDGTRKRRRRQHARLLRRLLRAGLRRRKRRL